MDEMLINYKYEFTTSIVISNSRIRVILQIVTLYRYKICQKRVRDIFFKRGSLTVDIEDKCQVWIVKLFKAAKNQNIFPLYISCIWFCNPDFVLRFIRKACSSVFFRLKPHRKLYRCEYEKIKKTLIFMIEYH